MFEGLIASVLNRILGNFIENIDANQLSISLWGGSVTLEDV
jgi:vacuolar protein sorting-associated protein 13A/C